MALSLPSTLQLGMDILRVRIKENTLQQNCKGCHGTCTSINGRERSHSLITQKFTGTWLPISDTFLLNHRTCRYKHSYMYATLDEHRNFGRAGSAINRVGCCNVSMLLLSRFAPAHPTESVIHHFLLFQRRTKATEALGLCH